MRGWSPAVFVSHLSNRICNNDDQCIKFAWIDILLPGVTLRFNDITSSSYSNLFPFKSYFPSPFHPSSDYHIPSNTSPPPPSPGPHPFSVTANWPGLANSLCTPAIMKLQSRQSKQIFEFYKSGKPNGKLSISKLNILYTATSFYTKLSRLYLVLSLQRTRLKRCIFSEINHLRSSYEVPRFPEK